MTQTHKSDQIPAVSPSKLRRNEIVKCAKCGLQLPRKKLKKHKQTHKSQPELLILDRAAKKSPQIRACQCCGEQREATWLFERTTRGPMNLCLSCKTKILKTSFSHESMERRRIASLKSELKDLKVQKSRLPPGTIDSRLSGSIIDVQRSIDRGPLPKTSWSPILPGSFESGKRR